jgi:translocation and assembly module TamB
MGTLPPNNDSTARPPDDQSDSSSEDRSTNAPIDSGRSDVSTVMRPSWVATAAKVTAGLLGLGLLGFIGASVWVATNLSPTIARELTKAFDRQVTVGPLENIGFNEINFGPSSLAANAESPNKIAVKKIKIGFDPLAILWQKTIKPNVTLVEPDIYLEQDASGDWLRLKLLPSPPGKPGDMRTEIQGIHVQKARGTVIPFSQNGLRQPVEFEDTDFNASFTHRDRTLQLINFDGKGQIGKAANLSLQGSTSPVDHTTNIDLSGQSLNAKQISDLIKIPAVEFRSGTVGGNLNISMQPNKPLAVTGKVRVDQSTIQIAKVPEVFNNTSGDLQISPQEVRLSNVATRYGQIPGQISGVIDFVKGYNLQAKTAVLPVATLLNNLRIKPPVFLAAQIQTDLALSGQLTQPILSGQAKTIGAAQIDRIALSQLQGEFALADGRLVLNQITGIPTSGGNVTGDGEIILDKLSINPPTVKLNLQGNKLLADVLAQPYQKLPIALGIVNLTAQVTGAADRLNTTLQIQAPQATYPLNAQIGIAPNGTVTVDRAKVQLAGRDITGTGSLKQGLWQARLQVPTISSQQLAAIAKVKDLPKFLQGNVQGDLQLTGALSNSESLSGKGQLQLQTAGGKVEATNFRIDRGKWQADLQTNGLVLGKIDPQLPGQLSGKFRVSGDTAKPEPESLLAVGTGIVTLPDGKITGQNLRISQGKWQGDFSADSFDISKFAPQVGGKLSGKFQASGDVTKLEPTTILATGVGTIASAQGKVTGQNLQLSQGKWQGDFSADSFDISKLAPQIGGRLSGKFQVNGDLQKNNLQDIVGSGSGTLRLAGGEVVGKDLRLSQGNWQGNLLLVKVPLGQLNPSIPAAWQSALINGNLQVAAPIDQPSKAQVQGDATVNLAGGQIAATGLQIGDGRWQGLFALKSINLQQLSLPANIPAGQLDGTFELAGTLDQPKLETAKGNGKLRLPGAELIADRVELTGDQWQGKFKTTNLPIGQFTTLPPGLAAVRVSSNFDLSGNLKTPQKVEGSGSGRVLIGNSEVALQKWQLGKGRWQVAASTKGLQLGSLGAVVPANLQGGVFAGNVDLSGSLDKPQLAAIDGQASGELSIWGGSVAVAPLQIAAGRWQSDRISIKNINLASIPGNTVLAGRLTGSAQASGRLDRFDVNDLEVASKIQVTGLLPSASHLAGLDKKLPPANLNGDVRITSGKIDLDLAGEGNLLSLHSTNSGLKFAGRLAGMESEGVIDGVELKLAARGVPIDFITSFLPPVPQIKKQELQGIVGGELTMDLLTGRLEGKNLSVDQPQIGILKGDRLQSGSVSYADGLLIVRDGQFLRGKNSYLVEGRVLTKSRQPEYQLKVDVQKGELADVSNLFQIFSFEDVLNPFGDRGYGNAGDLRSAKVGGELANLQEQVDRLSEVRRLRGIQEGKIEENPFPDLRKLDGDFAGTIVISNAAKQGVYASFNVSGEDWHVDRYDLSKVNLQGLWQNNVLTLSDFSLLSTNSKVQIKGEFGFDRQNADISVSKFPAERLSSLFKLPIDVAGDVELNAHLDGTWFDPQLTGNATFSDGKLNQSDIASIYTDFNYNNARLGFNSIFKDSKATANSPNEPLRIAGSVPYQLPFALKSPDNQNFSINFRLQNEGMKALTVLTQQQLNWVNGDGQINVLLKGKLDSLGKAREVTARGEATVANATLQAVALPDNLTNVNGKVSFDLDRVKVENFQGKYGTGEITAKGSISIEKPIDLSDQLTVNLTKIVVNLKDKYQGGIEGRLLLGGGTVLAPTLGGQIKLSNGKIFLPETAAAASGTATAPSEAGAIQFQNLELILGENLQVDKAPVLSFLATGKVNLNGSLENLQPEGKIQLGRGQINLFTTRFRLNGNENTAEFKPDRGADPIVNLQLSTKVLETSRLPSFNSSNERIDKRDQFSTGLGAVQSVQVDAKVSGPASQATDRIALTSNPGRSQDEIFLLLGNGLARLSPDESGLLNFAGSTAITYVQDVVTDLLGLSDFRIYPALTRSEDRNSTTSTLGLAAEVGVDINKSVSASVFKILTNGELPQYSIRYRINDRLLLRGSSNLSNDSRAILEYEERF